MSTDRQPMTRARYPEPTMHLPAGKTCANCVHFSRCNMLFGHIEEDEICDWSPSRFFAIAEAASIAAAALAPTPKEKAE